MIRKLLTSILCLVLALSLPLCALAATEYTVTIEPGDELASISAVKDLLDVLTLRVLAGEQSGMLSLGLSGTDVLSLAVRATGEGVYAQSDSLGEKPLYFSMADLEGLFGSMMSSGSSASASPVFQQGLEHAITCMNVSAQDHSPAPANQAEAEAQIRERFSYDPELAEFMGQIVKNGVYTEGEFTDAAHDPATHKVALTITNENLEQMAKTNAVKKMMISNSSTPMTEEEAVAAFQKALEKMDFHMLITIYTADEGNTLVSMTMPMTMKGTAEETETEDGKTTTETETVDMAMDMAYNRLTAEGKTNHAVSFLVKDEGEEEMAGQFTIASDGQGSYTLDGLMAKKDDGQDKPVLSFQGALTQAEATVSGWVGMLAENAQMTLTLDGATTAEGMQKSIAVYTRENATAILAPAASDRPMVTLKLLKKAEVAETALAAVNAATPDTATQLLQLKGEEQETALNGILTKLQQTLFTAMGLLPESVMQMVMGGQS